MRNSLALPAFNYFGAGCLDEAIQTLQRRGFQKALIVAGPASEDIKEVSEEVRHVTSTLTFYMIEVVVFGGVGAYSSDSFIEERRAALNTTECDLLISVGNSLTHEYAKIISHIVDARNMDASAFQRTPLVLINTRYGFSAAISRRCDDIKLSSGIVDRDSIPFMSINDFDIMSLEARDQTVATGMVALSHAIEAYVSTKASPISDACALKAIELITLNLRIAGFETDNSRAGEQLAYACALADMAFSAASSGYVHAMTNQIVAICGISHGVCASVLLPYVESFNAKVCTARLMSIASAMGVHASYYDKSTGGKACIDAIRRLSADVGMPASLSGMGIETCEIYSLTENILRDAFGATNPRKASRLEIEQILLSAQGMPYENWWALGH